MSELKTALAKWADANGGEWTDGALCMLGKLWPTLEAFESARVMAGPEDAKDYIQNHEVAHDALDTLRKELGL